MICAACGGPVTWRGPIYDLTHTECESCGAQNSRLPEQTDDDELDGDEAVVAYYGL